MYPSFGGLSYRSRSTTDVQQASSLEDASYPAVSYSSLSRSININQKNRRRKGPEPPRRTDSLATSEAAAVTLKRARSYLTDDIRRQFELGFESSASPKKVIQSPKSDNFVKRLVATLERRQKESSVNKSARRADDEFCSSSFREEDFRQARNTVPGSREQQLQREQIFEALGRDYSFQSRRQLPCSQLEDLEERENEEDYGSDLSNASEAESYFWSNKSEDIPEKNNKIAEQEPEKASSRRSLKSMLTSLISWRSAKSLPKGSRDYYAARESLGEEMRAFRRDTMPQLMEHAAIKSRLNIANRDELDSKEQREFSEMIGSPKLLDEKSIATIHSVHGAKTTMPVQHRFSASKELAQDKEIIYGSKKVQPPAVPLRAKQQTLPAGEAHLLRPSVIKDLQKRLSRESADLVQLRKQQLHQQSDVIYDVPTSNHRVVPPIPASSEENENGYLVMRSIQLRVKPTPPVYENAVIKDDKRLHCTMFTSF